MYRHDHLDRDADDDLGHEELLESLVTDLLASDTLEQLCTDADLPILVASGGDPVTLTARTYRDAGVLTMNCGIYLELSDGSAFGLTVTVSRRPSTEVTLRH
ncbi:hypothetical protein ABZS66_59175 [Dactylosporangium sp. NPDC005572]|uniref:hypothetical protein n=1 Tax=Dactylosporangium sp. NPDC005572 TaxID=3156889 RepID=UPI0033A29E8A